MEDSWSLEWENGRAVSVEVGKGETTKYTKYTKGGLEREFDRVIAFAEATVAKERAGRMGRR